MDFQGTETVAAWILYAAAFVFGAGLVGGTVYIFAVRKMRSLADVANNDNRRWEFGNVQGMLALLIVLSFIGVVFAYIFTPPNLDEKTKENLSILLGFLGGQFVVVCSFYFGSTVQNKAKDEAVRLTAEAAVTTATAQAATAETMRNVISGTGSGLVPPAVATLTTTTATEVTKPTENPSDPVVSKTTSESVTVPVDPPKGGPTT